MIGNCEVKRLLRSPGEPLDPSPRGLMERRFGKGFGEVRVQVNAASTAFFPGKTGMAKARH
jgi:hypothetical protein